MITKCYISRNRHKSDNLQSIHQNVPFLSTSNTRNRRLEPINCSLYTVYQSKFSVVIL